LRHASSEQDVDTPESAGLWGADWGSAPIKALKASNRHAICYTEIRDSLKSGISGWYAH